MSLGGPYPGAGSNTMCYYSTTEMGTFLDLSLLNGIDGFVNVYESEVTSGFYEGKHDAEGEFPGDRRPNEAFMKSAEDIWSMVEGYLNKNDYVPKSLYENFLGHQVNRIWQNTTSGSLSGTCWKKQRNFHDSPWLVACPSAEEKALPLPSGRATPLRPNTRR